MPHVSCVGAPILPPFIRHLNRAHLNRAILNWQPSCKMNDPNGPAYDAKHGVYHLFFQDHVAIPPGQGPVYGHVVSRDLAHWARMPVAIWNDEPYDSVAVYTGSATVLEDGSIAQIYPGICNKSNPALWPTCATGVNLNIAVPANASDPLLTHWAKSPHNPIANNTQRDPSTAWRTRHGEWRLVTYDASVYASLDFVRWYRVGVQPGFTMGECPSLYPLPRTTPGAAAAPPDAKPPPTHVHKCKCCSSKSNRRPHPSREGPCYGDARQRVLLAARRQQQLDGFRAAGHVH